MRGFAAAGVVALLLGSTFMAFQWIGGDASADPSPPEGLEPIAVGGGTAWVPPGFQAGERFLQPVEWPDHLVNPFVPDANEEQPGDGHDDELLTLNRRYTNRSYLEEPWTGGLFLQNVHGTPTNPICICDATFIMFNESGHDPTRPLRIRGSSYILIDNLIVYGGGIDIEYSSHVIITRTLMIDTDGIQGWFSDDALVSDIQISSHGGPFEFAQVTSEFGLLGKSPCWPEPICPLSLIELIGADRWTIEWSYFYGEGGIAIASGTYDTIIRHNSLYGVGIDTSNGDTLAEWNLFRSWGKFGMDLASPTIGRLENNTMILYAEVDPVGLGTEYSPGVFAQHCQYCVIKNNDFLGHGYLPDYGLNPDVRATEPVLWNRGGYVIADDNYWGTLHDPRLPPGQWIKETTGAQGQTPTTVLSRWYTQPIHDVPPLAPILNPGDYPWWVEQATGTDLPLI